jgi:hypothetical protein
MTVVIRSAAACVWICAIRASTPSMPTAATSLDPLAMTSPSPIGASGGA